MNRIIILIFLLSVSFNVSACLNGDSKILKNGTILYMDHAGTIPYGHNFAMDDGFKSTFREIDSLYKATKDLDYLSDKGLLLILLKEYDKAIELYLKIEKIKPNRYSTASNIGTVYELTGDNENALKWIKRSIEIDPKSHNSSEWIHVKILEAKLKEDHPFNSLELINTDFGTDSLPKTSLSKEVLTNLGDAIYYQVNERISFIKPKDKIVAQLLFDLANITFLSGNPGDAILIYDEANEYGFDSIKVKMRKVALAKDIIKYWDNLRAKRFAEVEKKYANHNSLYLVGGAAIVIIGIIVVFVIRRRRKL
jgi:tetratricopeptide (TPR) repeat protein